MQLPEFLHIFQAKLIADKRILSGVIATVMILLSVGGYFGYQELAKRWAIPAVS